VVISPPAAPRRLLSAIANAPEGAIALFLPLAWGRSGATLTETWGVEDRVYLDAQVAAAHGRHLQTWGPRAMGEDAPEAPLLVLRAPPPTPRTLLLLVDRGMHPRHRMRAPEGPPQLAAIAASLHALGAWQHTHPDAVHVLSPPDLEPTQRARLLDLLRGLPHSSTLTLDGQPLPPGPSQTPHPTPGWALGQSRWEDNAKPAFGRQLRCT